MVAVGARLPIRAAARIFFVGQLGKYIPGSFFQILSQVEMAHECGSARRKTSSAVALQLTMTITTALIILLFSVPFVSTNGRLLLSVLLVLPLLCSILHPRIFNFAVNFLLRRLGRPGLGPAASWASTLHVAVWAIFSWIAVGMQVLVLAVGLGAQVQVRTVALAVGGFALAWVIGFVVFVAPAGAGGRDAALAVSMSPVLDHGSVLVLALASRLLLVLADLTLAGVSALLTRKVGR
ncbi:MAG: hypothetical protein ACRC35_03200 [Angustibacter sp.]